MTQSLTHSALTACAQVPGTLHATRLARADAGLLLAFYTGLDDAERHARFGGAAAAVSRHCDALDWADTAVIAWSDSLHTVAMAEVHLPTEAHATAELAVACPDRTHAVPVWRDAIRFAATAAAGRHCRTLHVASNAPRPFLPALLREAGQLALIEDGWLCMLPAQDACANVTDRS